MNDDLGMEWPTLDYSRVSFDLYHDPRIYEQEQERVFRGRTWSFLGLEAEIPVPGDFRTCAVGDTPVVYNRGEEGKVHCFVNRCAHRGASVRREVYGNTRDHTCIYHRWCYDLEGNLIGVPFQRGVHGKGGMSDDFDKTEHGLRKLRVETLNGIIFGTFSEGTEPLQEYLGDAVVTHLKRLMNRPIRIVGYLRQRIHGNWKMYLENAKDSYHATLLHEFLPTFAITRVTQKVGSTMDPQHRHNINYSEHNTDTDDAARQIYRDNKVEEGRLKLRDNRLMDYFPEFGGNRSLAINTVFPNAVFQQIRNSLATRQIRTAGVDEFELYWTLFGYEDDDELMTEHRLRQSNLVGPGGLVSMEDGEAIEMVHRATRSGREGCSVIEMGGRGELPDEIDFKATDVALRGFWSYYSQLMGMEPAGAVR